MNHASCPASDLRIEHGPELDAGWCRRIHDLAVTAYSVELLIPEARLRAWHRANPEIFWLALQGDALAGYLSALPLAPQVFRRTFEPTFCELSTITPDAVRRYRDPGEYAVFVSSIVVAERHRGSSPVSRLLRVALLEDLARLEARGIMITELSSEAVSEAGERAMASLGMTLHAHARTGGRLLYARTGPGALRRRAQALRSRLSGREEKTPANED